MSNSRLDERFLDANGMRVTVRYLLDSDRVFSDTSNRVLQAAVYALNSIGNNKWPKAHELFIESARQYLSLAYAKGCYRNISREMDCETAVRTYGHQVLDACLYPSPISMDDEIPSQALQDARKYYKWLVFEHKDCLPWGC